MENDQVKPMTPEEIAEEDAFAERCFQDFQHVDLEKAREIIKRHRRSPITGMLSQAKAASLLFPKDS